MELSIMPRLGFKAKLARFLAVRLVLLLDLAAGLKPRLVGDSDAQPVPRAGLLLDVVCGLELAADLVLRHRPGPDRLGLARQAPSVVVIDPAQSFLMGELAPCSRLCPSRLIGRPQTSASAAFLPAMRECRQAQRDYQQAARAYPTVRNHCPAPQPSLPASETSLSLIGRADQGMMV
jgi:hypothetical protein